MKNFLLGFLCLISSCLFAQRPVQTISNGGGKTITGAFQLASNTYYTNYIFSGNAELVSNGVPISNVSIVGNIFQNIGMCVFIGTYAVEAPHTNKWINIQYNTIRNFSGSQYYFEIQSTDSFDVSHNYFADGSGSGDGGVVYNQYSMWGRVHNNYANRFHGKFYRCWAGANSRDTVYSNVLINTDMYSGMEVQELGVNNNTNWHVGVANNVFGNYPVLNATPTGAITVYYPDKPTASYSFENNVVFNTSKGLLDNGGNITGPYAPTNSNWQSVNKYYATQVLAGYTSDSIPLPDGTNWNGVSTPPVNPKPVANAGSNQSVIAGNAITLNGAASTGVGLLYSWKQLTGPSTVPIINSTSVSAGVTGMGIGSYIFQLTVTDSQGAASVATVTYTIGLPVCQVCPAPIVCPLAPFPITVGITFALINGVWTPTIATH